MDLNFTKLKYIFIRKGFHLTLKINADNYSLWKKTPPLDFRSKKLPEVHKTFYVRISLPLVNFHPEKKNCRDRSESGKTRIRFHFLCAYTHSLKAATFKSSALTHKRIYGEDEDKQKSCLMTSSSHTTQFSLSKLQHFEFLFFQDTNFQLLNTKIQAWGRKCWKCRTKNCRLSYLNTSLCCSCLHTRKNWAGTIISFQRVYNEDFFRIWRGADNLKKNLIMSKSQFCNK